MGLPKASYVDRRFGLALVWQKAAEAAGLPGSSCRVLQVLLGHRAQGRGPLPRKGIARRSGMPLSTVRDGVDGLLAADWIIQRAGGLELALEAPAAKCSARPSKVKPATVPVEEEGGRISPPSNSPLRGKEEKEFMAPQTPVPGAGPAVAVKEPEKLSPERQAIEAMLLHVPDLGPGGARAAAKATPLNPQEVKLLLENLEDLVGAGRYESVPRMAVWACKAGRGKAKELNREARRLRGKWVRQVRPEPEPVVSMDRARVVGFKAERARVLREAVRALTPAQKVIMAGQVRIAMASAPADLLAEPWIRTRMAMSAWWDLLLGDLAPRPRRSSRPLAA